MTDRELLEAAAKAAGAEWSDYSGRTPDHWQIKHSDGFWREWNPLTDDGDALRLAMKLGMTIRIDTRAGFSWIKGFEGSEPHGSDPYAATRRAIVRAAAAMAG